MIILCRLCIHHCLHLSGSWLHSLRWEVPGFLQGFEHQELEVKKRIHHKNHGNLRGSLKKRPNISWVCVASGGGGGGPLGLPFESMIGPELPVGQVGPMDLLVRT